MSNSERMQADREKNRARNAARRAGKDLGVDRKARADRRRVGGTFGRLPARAFNELSVGTSAIPRSAPPKSDTEETLDLTAQIAKEAERKKIKRKQREAAKARGLALRALE